MRLLYAWPLALLILIPAIVLLYLLKQKAEEERVSSLYLWKAVYKNLQASTPWEKFKNNLLMYLQIAAMALLILALTSPYLTKGGTDYQNVLLVIDHSGSMNSIYEGDITRLEAAKEQAKSYVEKLPSDVRISLITGGREASVLLSNSSDKAEIKRVIEEIEGTDCKGTLDVAVNLTESVASGLENYQAVFFTDSSLDIGKLQGEIVNLNTKGTNVSVDYVSHKRENDGSLTVLIKVSNTGNEPAKAEINLYLDDTLSKVKELGEQTGEIAEKVLKPGESEIVYFKDMDSSASVIRAELNEADSLVEDNVAFDVLSGGSTQKVLLVSEQNVFLEKAIATLPDIEIYKTPNVADIGEEAFDLYIFDGVVPYTLPKEGNLLFFNPPRSVEGLFKVEGIREGAWVTTKEHVVTAYLEEFTFGVNEIVAIEEPEWAESFLSYEESSAGFVGKTAGRSVGVVAFDIHHSDLPLQTEFPILIYGLVNECLEGSLIGTSVIEAGEKLAIYSQDADEEIVICGELLKGQREERIEGASSIMQYEETMETGLYSVKKGEAEAVFAVNFPVVESQTFGAEVIFTGETIESTTGNEAAGNQKSTFVPNGGVNLRTPLIICVLVLLALEWYITLGQGVLPRKDIRRRRTIQVLQGSVVLLLLLAIWNPSVNMGNKDTTTIFLVDVSDSVSGQKQEIEQFVKDALKEMPTDNKAGVIAFGADSRVEQFVSEKNLFMGLETVPVTTATNLEQAVQGALALFPEEEGKRLVLITDGKENEGSLKAVTQSVRNGNVQVQVKKLASLIGEEVFVENLQVPDKINIGDTFKVEVTIQSNVKTGALLSLYAGNALKSQREVELETGSNRFVFKDVQEADGLKTYRVIIEPAKDTKSINNEYTAFTRAEAPSKVLLIEGKEGTSAAMEEILAAANINYQLAVPGAAPRTIMEMNQYKSVVLLNVHADDLPEGFMSNIEAYVRDYAGGLVAIGGDNSFALGNYRGSVLEKVLPVYMDLQGEKEVPKMAVALVIDRSGSMAGGNEFYNQLELAKESAVAALDTLRETDEIGVIAFESSYEWVVPMTTATDRESLEDAIYSIGLGGGTSIYPAVDAACQKLKESNAKLKHIILLTDGQDGFNQYEDLLEDLNQSGITLSTVAVGDGADAFLLEYLAEEGKGRIYYTDIDTDIPRIFAKEIYLSVNSYLINEPFTPIRTAQKDMLDGVVEDGLPVMYGYIASTKKELATLHLMSEKEDPILTSWQYGLGKTVAFNSDGENNWTANYAAWSDYPLFWKNIIEYTMTSMSATGNDLSIEQRGSGTQITYTTESYNEATSVEVVATDEEGNSQKVVLNPTSPGVFEGNFVTKDTGVYSINVTQREEGEVVSIENTATAVQYSSEYRIAEDNGLLEEWVKETSGTFIEEPKGIFEKSVKHTDSKRSLATYFLLAAVLLFMAVIVWKRLDVRRLEVLKRLRKNEETAVFAEIQKVVGTKKKKSKTMEPKEARRNESVPKEEVRAEKPQVQRKAAEEASDKQEEVKNIKTSESRKSENKREMLDTAALLKKKKDRS